MVVHANEFTDRGVDLGLGHVEREYAPSNWSRTQIITQWQYTQLLGPWIHPAFLVITLLVVKITRNITPMTQIITQYKYTPGLGP